MCQGLAPAGHHQQPPAAGDVLETEVDAISGGGAMGKGIFAYVELEEDYD